MTLEVHTTAIMITAQINNIGLVEITLRIFFSPADLTLTANKNPLNLKELEHLMRQMIQLQYVLSPLAWTI